MAIQKLFTSLSKQSNSSAYIGEKNRLWYDTNLGFRISDGVNPGGSSAVVAVSNANIGNLVIANTTISTRNTNEDLNLASNGTGNVNITGAFTTANTAGGTIIETLQNGTVNFFVPSISYDSAIDIIGTADGTQLYPQNQGVLLHLTGQASLPARIYSDGVNNYAAFIGRRYNGNATAPTQVLAGQTISRYGGTPYSSSGWPSISTARVDFVALEDQTATNRGTSIQFFTTPAGSTNVTPSMTVASTGISNAANVVPITDEVYYLGSPALRWQGVYVGKAGLTIADNTTNQNVPISVNNGTLYLNGTQSIAIGNLVITDTTLQTSTTSANINIGDTGDSGILDIGRTVRIRTQNLNNEAALLINGTLTNIVPTEYTNTLMHTVAVPGYNGIHLNDAFGGTGNVNLFPTYEGRAARGNIASPSASQSGDILLRLSAAGYGTNAFDTALGTQGGSRIDFRATENYTNTAKGSDIHFWTTQPGTTSTVNSGSIDWQGFSGNGFTFTTDGTTQTTAGIPLTQRAVANGVATLGIDGRLSSNQIPTSLVGAIVFQGGWNAANNTPTLSDGTGTTGYQYIVTTGGTRDLGHGNISFSAGDTVTYGANIWNWVQGSSPISSVSGNLHMQVSPTTGAVTVGIDATPNNVAGTVVSRDGSGNFTANTITATLSGSATSAGTAATVTGNTQSAIAQVGTLISLTVTGNVASGNVSGTKGTFTNIAGNIITAAQTNITSVGTLTGLTLSGTLTGTAVNAATIGNTGASLTGTLLTNAQPNITSVGTLGSLSVTGNVTAGNVNVGSMVLANNAIYSSATASDITIGQTSATANVVFNRTTVHNKDVTVNGNVSVTGNVTAGNVNAAVTGNVTGTASRATSLTAATSILAGNLSITPSAIGKNTTSTQTFTLTGLTTSHKVVITSANDMAYGIIITAAYASALNTLSVQFTNLGGAATPAAMGLQYFAWV